MINLDDYPRCVFDTARNVLEQPQGSRFFLGETVMHVGNKQLYTVCDLSNYESDYYGLWPIGRICAIPTHGSYGKYLEPISSTIEPLRLQ